MDNNSKSKVTDNSELIRTLEKSGDKFSYLESLLNAIELMHEMDIPTGDCKYEYQRRQLFELGGMLASQWSAESWNRASDLEGIEAKAASAQEASHHD